MSRPHTNDDLEALGASAALRALGSPEALRSRVLPEDPGPTPPHNCHLHLPPNSSAFISPEQAVRLASAQQCVLVGANNYYDFSVYERFTAAARAAGVLPLYGLEIICRDQRLAEAGVKVNDPANPGRIYLCGKGVVRFGQPGARAQEILGRVREIDRQRIVAMMERCVEALCPLGCPIRLSPATVIADIAARVGVEADTIVLQERHLAQALQQAIFAAVPVDRRAGKLAPLLGGAVELCGADDAAGWQQLLRSRLMRAGAPAYVVERHVGLDEARALIGDLGGLVAYPVVGDGMTPPSPFEADPAVLAAWLRAQGIPLAEFIPPRNHPEALARQVVALRRAGLVVTAGTEHNAEELLPIDPRCLGGAGVPEAARRIFWEGARVIAAHQFLVAHGRPGLSAAPVDEARIADFAALGGAVVAAWRQGAGHGAAPSRPTGQRRAPDRPRRPVRG